MKIRPFKINSQLLLTCVIYLLSLLVIKSALAHQQGVIDTHFTPSPKTVKMTYTIPTAKLETIGATQNPLSIIARGFVISNDNQPCIAKPGISAPLDNINSQQFFISYQCADPLAKVVIQDRFADIDGYQNFARFSLLGMAKSVTFSTKTPSHEFAVGAILAMKNASLAEQAQPTFWQNLFASSDYLPVGLAHILLGPDHVLFLLGLILLITSTRQLLILITCFTLSHSVALALAVLDIINLSAAVIEPLIALSIVYIAVENLTKLSRPQNSKTNHQWLVVTLFGFIHGFGFSFLLKTMGHENGLASALAFFNIGVEIGQLIIVVPLFLLFNKLPTFLPNAQTPLLSNGFIENASTPAKSLILPKQAISLVTGAIGLYWLFERTTF